MAPGLLFAFPDQERAAPSLVTSQATSMISDGDGILFVSFGDSVVRIDTETWLLATEQVPELADNSDEEGGEDLRGDVLGLAIRGDFLYASQSDGDLLVVDLDDLTEDPNSIDLGTSSLGEVVADPEGGVGDDKVYIADRTANAVLVYDISDGRVVTTIPLADSLGNPVAPVSLTFVSFPTASTSSATDKIYVTTNSGIVFVIQEGGSTVSRLVQLSSTNKDLPAAGIAPDGNFLFVVNATDVALHVIDTATDAEIDTDTATGGVNPIAIAPNGSLKDVVVTDVEDPDDIYAYVSGSGGLTVIDLNISLSLFETFDLLDFNDEGDDDDEDDPLPLSSIPGPLVASSLSDGIVYSSNSNGTISVVSDNPFVTIGSTSLGTGSLGVGGTFTVTFQSDEVGDYRVRVGGDLTESGSQVTSGTVDTAAVDVTTAEIAYDSGIFTEGTNRVFVFVEDSEGNVGRDAVDVTVDTPPPQVQIEEMGFGNQSIFVTFARLDVIDIDRYDVYVDTNSAEVLTKTIVAGTLAQPVEDEEVGVRVTGLTNGVTYYAAVEAVDRAGNVGPRGGTLPSGAAASAIPQATIGIMGTVGEGGCSLIPRNAKPGRGVTGGGVPGPLADRVHPPAGPAGRAWRGGGS